MKKLRFVVPTLVLAVAMMGAGYAAWTQNLTIGNTVNTATFGFTFDDSPTATLTGANRIGATTVNQAAKTDGTHATINLNNLYPGVVATVDFPITNTSTIPAVLSDYSISPATLKTGLTAETKLYVDGVETTNTTIPALKNVKIEYIITATDALDVAGTTYSADITPKFDQQSE